MQRFLIVATPAGSEPVANDQAPPCRCGRPVTVRLAWVNQSAGEVTAQTELEACIACARAVAEDLRRFPLAYESLMIEQVAHG